MFLLETYIFYKETNSHDYLNYFSHHPEHTQQNIQYSLAKQITVFVSDKTKMNESLSDLKTWLLSCSYPLTFIDKACLTLNCRDLHLKKKIYLFRLYQHRNFDLKSISITANLLLSSVKDNKLKNVFDKCKVIHSLKQPKSLHQMFFISNSLLSSCTRFYKMIKQLRYWQIFGNSTDKYLIAFLSMNKKIIACANL